jgi:hypothetical protein
MPGARLALTLVALAVVVARMRRRAIALTVLCAGLLAQGCGDVARCAAVFATANGVGAPPVRCLAAATPGGEEEQDVSEEDPGLNTGAEVAPGRRRLSVAVHGGLFVPVGGDRAGYTATAGVSAHLGVFLGGVTIEGGIATARIEGEDLDITSVLYQYRGDVLVNVGRRGATSVHVIVGLGCVQADSDIYWSSDTFTELDMAVAFGCAVRWQDRWETRVVYDVLWESDNLDGFLSVSGGMRF